MEEGGQSWDVGASGIIRTILSGYSHCHLHAKLCAKYIIGTHFYSGVEKPMATILHPHPDLLGLDLTCSICHVHSVPELLEPPLLPSCI